MAIKLLYVHEFYQLGNTDLYLLTNLPADVFGVVFNVVWEVSNLIFSNALQPIHHQLFCGAPNQK